MTKITKEMKRKKLWCILLVPALAMAMMPLTGGTAYAETLSVLDINIESGNITFEKEDEDHTREPFRCFLLYNSKKFSII